MDNHDLVWKTEALNLLGLPNEVLKELKDEEINVLWSLLKKFFGDATTADKYNKLKEE